MFLSLRAVIKSCVSKENAYMDKKKVPMTKELPVYEVPKITTYSEADILADLGKVNASEDFDAVYLSVLSMGL